MTCRVLMGPVNSMHTCGVCECGGVCSHHRTSEMNERFNINEPFTDSSVISPSNPLFMGYIYLFIYPGTECQTEMAKVNEIEFETWRMNQWYICLSVTGVSIVSADGCVDTGPYADFDWWACTSRESSMPWFRWRKPVISRPCCQSHTPVHCLDLTRLLNEAPSWKLESFRDTSQAERLIC